MLWKNSKASLGLAAMFLTLCLSGGCTSYAEPPKTEASLFAMNTYMSFTAYGENAEFALTGAKERVQELESLWSVTDEVNEIEYEGRINTIEIKDHQIHMQAAECPDNTCVHMRWLDSAAPIVCLPNHLVIQFAENHEALDGIAR